MGYLTIARWVALRTNENERKRNQERKSFGLSPGDFAAAPGNLDDPGLARGRQSKKELRAPAIPKFTNTREKNEDLVDLGTNKHTLGCKVAFN